MVDILLQKIKENCTNVDLDIVNKAFNLAYEAHKEQKRESGEPYIIHPIDVAVILAELGMDTSTIVAGLLHDVIEDTDYTYDDIKNIFSDREKDLVYFLMIVCYMVFFYYQMCITWGGLNYVSEILNLRF